MFFTVEKIEKQLAEIRTWMDRGVQEIPCFKYFVGDGAGFEAVNFDDRSWQDFSTGATWGGYDVKAWFRSWVLIPLDWRQKKLVLRFWVGPRDGGGSTAETLLYVNGKPLQGLDIWHTEAWLPPELANEGKILVALKAWSGVIQVPERRQFKRAELVWIDETVEHFMALASTLLKVVKSLPENNLGRIQMLQALNEAVLQIDYSLAGSEMIYECIETAGAQLRERVAAYSNLAELKPRVIGVGHAHIDMAWLWRLKDTREKAARTFSTVLHLMRQYPEYRFVHSSPQLYQYLKQDYPQIYDQVKERIRQGQWEVTGGMWVEADTNLTSGESLVRQLLHGRQFVRDEFGIEMKTLWLPDVFGYSAALPQIAVKSGLKYFLTSKISWNQFNRFPYDTFRWRGLDGTELFTHFITTPDHGSQIYTYNGQLEPEEVKGLWENYQQKEANSELLTLFGWGDGGGGPTNEMIESAQEMKNLPGIPRVELGKAEDYFERLEQRLAGVSLPVWDGELYLEYHRGTYTSQAYNKRANRMAEILYHQAEWVSTLAELLGRGNSYPAASLRKGWELILLNQFHDILPGSAIHPVYEDSRKDYEQIEQIGQGALEAGLLTLAQGIQPETDSLIVFNALPWKRSGVIEMPFSDELFAAATLKDEQAWNALQLIDVDGHKKVLVETSEVPSLGYQCLPVESLPNPHNQTEASLVITQDYLENQYYRIEINPQGQISSIWDKRQGRAVLEPGQAGNRFCLFIDKPMNFDAWDIDIYYQEKCREITNLVEIQVAECGPIRGALRMVWKFGHSQITQWLTIYRNSSRIDFRTQVDWHEHQTLLKVAFPVNVRSTRATYDIQFGNLERSTHWNTSWDYARFEVSAHKWADLSEGDYGIALLNDCKYGYDIKDNVLRLTLIKSGIDPDPEADQGQHLFTYSLLPHAGDWRTGCVIEEAYQLNDPLIGRWAAGLGAANERSRQLSPRFSLAAVDADHVILETVKKSEDGQAWIFRLYETKQCRRRGTCLWFGLPIQQAVECNLMEEDERPVEFTPEAVFFDIAPYEIKTFKVWF